MRVLRIEISRCCSQHGHPEADDSGACMDGAGIGRTGVGEGEQGCWGRRNNNLGAELGFGMAADMGYS